MIHESAFRNWPFTSSLCIEKLKVGRVDNPSLSYNLASGGFTPHDFSKGWKGARSDTKKSFIMNDLGM